MSRSTARRLAGYYRACAKRKRHIADCEARGFYLFPHPHEPYNGYRCWPKTPERWRALAHEDERMARFHEGKDS